MTYEVSKLLAKMSNRDFMNFDEKCIKSLYIGLIHNDGFEVYSEYPASSGYIDLLLRRKGILGNYDIMIELKYLKKSNRKLLESKRVEAIEQLKRYSQDERINKPDLKKYAIIFIGSDYKIYEV